MEEEYQELIQTFTTIIHVDVVPPLLRLLRPIDFLYHGAGDSKRRVNNKTKILFSLISLSLSLFISLAPVFKTRLGSTC